MGRVVESNISSSEFTIPLVAEVGDVVLMSDAGLASVADPRLPIAKLNNNTVGFSAVVSGTLATPLANSNYSPSDQIYRKLLAKLNEDQIVFLAAGNGSSSTTDLVLTFFNSLGLQYRTPVVITKPSATVSAIGIEALKTGNFLVFWRDSGETTFKYAVYTSNGAVVKATSTGPAASPTATFDYAAGGLADGGFVLAYRTGTTVKYTRYDSVGVAQGSEVTVSAVDAGYLEVLGMTNGDFVIKYRVISGPVWKFSRYSSSGTLIGSAVSMPNSNYQNSDICWQTLAELADGRLAISYRAGAPNNYGAVGIYNADNSLDITLDMGSNFASLAFSAITAMSDGGFVIAHPGTSSYQLRKYDSNNNLVVAASVSDGGNSDSPYGIVMSECNLGVVVMRYGTSSTPDRRVSISVVAPNLVIKGTPVQVYQYEYATSKQGMVLANNNVVVTYSDASGTPRCSVYLTTRTSVFGVVTASDATLALVGTEGAFALRQNFPIGGSFTAKANTAPGNAGFVLNNSANLTGL